MHPYYIELRRIVDSCIEMKERDHKLKKDFSLVTNVDLMIDKEIRSWFLSKTNDNNPTIITEETYNSRKNSFDLSKGDYLILDPIDGTENFMFLNDLYGCTCSLRIESMEYHFIYIPKKRLLLTHDTISMQETSNHNNLVLLSSGTIQKYIDSTTDVRNIRVFGSSSYMFSLVLSGFCKEYLYLADCKIWDCYTGISLAHWAGLQVEGINFSVWKERPTFYSNFIIKNR